MFENDLNKEQLDAVSHILGPCLVSACPGAGKTRVIAYRAINLLRHKIDPSKILLVTFTNKASREMRERIEKLAKKYDVPFDGMTISTFHSFCLDILRKNGNYNGRRYSSINILDEDDCMSLLKNICEDIGIELEKSELQSFKSRFDSLREQCMTIDEVKKEMSKKENGEILVEKYISAFHGVNGIDFSGIMYEFYIRLISDENFRAGVCAKYKFLMIDEVQDTNIIQFKIANILASGHSNIFMVGDTDQSIYQWRGAKPSQVADYIKNNNCKVYRLTKNYRCTANITNIASNIISNNKNRLNERITPHKANGDPVIYSVFMTREEEASNIAKRINKLKYNGVKYKDIAVLVRAGYLTRNIENAFMVNSIPYCITGGFRFFDREEIKDVVSMLKFLHNKNDVLSFSRFMNKPKRGLGGKCVQTIHSAGLRNFDSALLSEIINNSTEIKDAQKKAINYLISNLFSVDVNAVSVPDLIRHVIKATEYGVYLKSFKDDTVDNKLENVEELIKSAESSKQNLADFLSSISLMSTPKEANEEDMVNSVKIMTMHASKGLEFQNVFMPCCEEHIIPHKRSIQDGPSAIDEERRLCYVAMTRGMERLFLSNSVFESKFDRNYKFPSRFLIEGGITDRERYVELVQEAQSNYMG